jgi:hypothetical protein
MGSVRLEPELAEKVRKVARMKGLSLSQVHRLALEAYCERALVAGSRYGDVIGVAAGESDLSSRSADVFREVVSKKHDRHLD